jgi:uncharacterized membrane protein (UPF0136 family)
MRSVFLADGSITGIWLLELFALFTRGFYLISNYCHVFPRIHKPFSAVILIILHYVRVFDFGNYTEEYAHFFRFSLWDCFFPDFGKTRPFLSGLTSGLLCGLAFYLQTEYDRYLGYFLDHGISFMDSMKKMIARKLSSRWIFFLFGLIAINGIWAFYFWNKGALQEYWDVAFLYNLNLLGAKRMPTAGQPDWTTAELSCQGFPFFFHLRISLSWLIVFIRFLNSLRMKKRQFLWINRISSDSFMGFPFAIN